MGKLDEELLEPVARRFRFGHGLGHVTRSRPVTVADLGCGPKVRFYHAARSSGVQIERYFGVDPLLEDSVVAEFEKTPDIELVKKPMEKQIPLPDSSVDYCVAFAFLEHIDFPDEILNDSLRVVKPGGKVIMTTPSYRAKPVLEFLSFKLGLISPREIEEHKNYFDGPRLLKMLEPSRERIEKTEHHYFEIGMNNLLVVTRKAT